jgi:alpha-tubulin N-acetyltransferase 1
MRGLRDGVLVVSGSALVSSGELDHFLSEKINEIGELSALAQNLKEPVTSAGRLKAAVPEQTVFLLIQGGQVQGILKTGRRHLYLSGDSGLIESTPICVLDFFVKDQRAGNGSILFQAMLSVTKISPLALAFDRPSQKLKQFLVKFGVDSLVMQNNHFSISPLYFTVEAHFLPETICPFPIHFLEQLV